MTDPRTRAIALRTVDGLSTGQIGAGLGVPPRTVARWLHGLPVPEWTKRPTAKDGLLERALRLRAAGVVRPRSRAGAGRGRSTAG